MLIRFGAVVDLLEHAHYFIDAFLQIVFGFNFRSFMMVA